MKFTPIEGSVAALAEQSKSNPNIGVDDIMNHAMNIAALQNWATGDEFDTTGVRDKLFELYPHLKDR